MSAPNTKARSLALQNAAKQLIEEQRVDVTQQVVFLPLAKLLMAQEHCGIDTAKRHIATAVRRARGELSYAQWGGYRPGAGRPKQDDRDNGA